MSTHLYKDSDIPIVWAKKYKAPKEQLSAECWMFNSRPQHPGTLNACKRCPDKVCKTVAVAEKPKPLISFGNIGSRVYRHVEFCKEHPGTRLNGKGNCYKCQNRDAMRRNHGKGYAHAGRPRTAEQT